MNLEQRISILEKQVGITTYVYEARDLPLRAGSPIWGKVKRLVNSFVSSGDTSKEEAITFMSKHENVQYVIYCIENKRLHSSKVLPYILQKVKEQ